MLLLLAFMEPNTKNNSNNNNGLGLEIIHSFSHPDLIDSDLNAD